MARIRTIKPEFWASHKTARVSLPARLLFLGLLNESDDEGRQVGSARRISGVLFPHDDDITTNMVGDWIDELEAVRLVARYEVDGVPYLLIPGFSDHQKVSHPTPSRLPEPPPENLPNGSGAAPETLVPYLGSRIVGSSSASDASIAGAQPVDNSAVDDELPSATTTDLVDNALALIVKKRIAGASGVKNPTAYRRKVTCTVIDELGERARCLAAKFPNAPPEAIAGHLEGEPSSLARHREPA